MEWTTATVIEQAGEERQIAVRPVQPHGVSELLVCVPDHPGLFASITSVLDEMGLDVMSARVLTTRNGRSFDLFQLMDQHGDVINEVDAEELVARLHVATSGREPREPVKRMMPRRLRHFKSGIRVQFSDDPDGEGTVLHLDCSDRPGLLSRLAAAIYQQDVDVHNARIATFGERVEDTFLVSDRKLQPLTEETCEQLKQAIVEGLEKG